MKALSVILLNYNHARWLRRSLAALAEQADGSIEVLAIDDGSNDDSVAVMEELARRHPAVRVLRHETNRGVSAGVRTGLANATGRYLLFAAADDLVLPGLLETAIATLDASPKAALFCTGTLIIDTDDRILGLRPVTPPRATSGYLTPAEVRHALRGTDNWFIGSSVVYRRAHLEAAGYFDESLGSLADGLVNRLLALEHGFCYEPCILSAWRRYAESFSGRVAMSFAASEASLAAARRYIEMRYPPDVRHSYAVLFDRRYRYNLARLRLAWGEPPAWRELAQFLRLGRLDAATMAGLTRIPACGRQLVLAWITLRMRPFSLTALARHWWSGIAGRRAGFEDLQRLVRSGEAAPFTPTRTAAQTSG